MIIPRWQVDENYDISVKYGNKRDAIIRNRIKVIYVTTVIAIFRDSVTLVPVILIPWNKKLGNQYMFTLSVRI